MKKLLFGILLLAASSAWCALSVVQSTGVYNNNNSSLTMIFNSAPTQGDLLVAGCQGGYNTPGGWSVIDSSVNAEGTFQTFDHVVGGSESNSYTFTLSGGANYSACTASDVTGQSASVAIDSHTITFTSGPSSITTSSATPSVIGDLPLSFLGTYIYLTPITCSSGWTVNYSTGTNNFYGGSADCSQNSLTSDTSTPIGNTFTMGGSSTQWAALVLIEPAPAYTGPKSIISIIGNKLTVQ